MVLEMTQGGGGAVRSGDGGRRGAGEVDEWGGGSGEEVGRMRSGRGEG